MIEREITSYRLEQPNKKIYIITTSLINEKIKILCKDSDSKIALWSDGLNVNAGLVFHF